MSLRHSILGLLASRPLTGYEIKKIFDDTLAHAWNAHDSQIYPELHRMEEEGLITVQAVSEGRRQRRVNQITDEGRAALQHWLESPQGRRITRDDFVLRVFFFGLLTGEQQLAWLEEEQKHLESELTYADEVVAQFGAHKPKTERARRLLQWQLACVELHATQVTARLEWVREAKDMADFDDRSPPAGDASGRHPR